MMFTMIILFCSATMIGSVAYSYHIMAKADGQRLMGVVMTKEGMEHPKTQEAVRDYNRRLKRFLIFTVLLHLPMLPLIQGYISIFIAVYTFWCLFLFLGVSHIYHSSFLTVYRLKREHGWSTGGNLHLVTVDTELSREKDRMPLDVRLFIPAFLLCLVPPVLFPGSIYGPGQTAMYIVTAVMMGAELLFVLLYCLFCRRRAVVYSENSEINLLINRIVRRGWSLCWIVSAYLNTLSFLALSLGFLAGASGYLWGLTGCLIFQSLMAAYLLYMISRINRRKQEILVSDTKPVMVDDDEYRLKGYYCNPDDPRLLIASPGGMNWELNLGRPAGRILSALCWGGLAVFMAGLIAFMAAMDFIPFGMEVEPELVRITAPVYGTSFPIDRIESVTLSDELPVHPLSRTNGASTEQYDLGHYRLKDGTKVRMYYYKNYSPVIRIDLEDGIVLFNTKDQERTREIYESLKRTNKESAEADSRAGARPL